MIFSLAELVVRHGLLPAVQHDALEHSECTSRQYILAGHWERESLQNVALKVQARVRRAVCCQFLHAGAFTWQALCIPLQPL
jgi:hypothetical protein